ncbi:MAG: precorrin-4 C(11)-methyltransferase [Mucispirillum sp.]|uniref:Precorrin-4 C(11)-methyltransferase n=1 Tax=Candidatus Mucispirillum faecigallinarum TaxID=2838699 RepID=A0A9D2KD51_9BACT|nr:precorrin-4 C(11)-methyltransferase [Mucispirillum sp.]HIZ90457.1 precorrin-4 C(11)-methyltransferase [Candidatus Mucispirillum faecigallinarum]
MVYFVGAGPGAVDLITIRGAELLKKADVIIYAGSLVNPELLQYAKKECVIYNSATMTLEEVIGVMEESHKNNKMVVRLHTGDMSIYGAVREQSDILKEKNIPFESVPGVSSFLGAAASLNAEYTLPDVSQTVILTRMAGRTPVPEKEDIKLLASHKASMVIFLSASMLGSLSEELIKGGYDKTTPCVIVYKATWDDEKKVVTTLENLEKAGKENGISKTALVLAGDFLGDKYNRSKLYDGSFTHEFRKGTNG